jgi:hypothetical protein
MSWLRCQNANRIEPPTPSLPEGIYLQPSSERGIWQLFIPAGGFRYDVYRGTQEEMLEIVATLEAST